MKSAPLPGSRLAAWALGLLSFVGCGGGPPRASAVIDWALGPEHRGSEPPPGDRYLLVLPPKRPPQEGKPVLPGCFPAVSFVPAPWPDPRIFFLNDGQIYVRRAVGEAPSLLPGSDPALGIRRLLAFDKEASPLELLVSAKPDGARSEQIWLLTIEDRAIRSVVQVTSDRGLTSQEAFFERYDVPRCLPGGHRCLVLSSDDDASYLDIQPIRGRTPLPLQELGTLAAIDATWATSEGKEIYLMVPCPERKRN